jgi:hypothetical protein
METGGRSAGWGEVFATFVVSHLLGDYLLQTDWQAAHKARGLGRDPIRRKALLTHVTTYTLSFSPALIWLRRKEKFSAGRVAGAAAAIWGEHAIQDDGRALTLYARRVKGLELEPGLLAMALDQSFHVVFLFAVAVAVGRRS